MNYQKKLDTELEKIRDTMPKLLLHSCCAPCSSYVIEYLSKHFNITVFYYNPNIQPKEEYEKRKAEQKRLLTLTDYGNSIEFFDHDYDGDIYETAVKGMESEPEGGIRCTTCFEIRLNKTAEIAGEIYADYFTTTLTVSPHKNAPLINEIGSAAGAHCGVKYLLSDFKKKSGYLRSIELAKKHELYRQNYCGCSYSK